MDINQTEVKKTIAIIGLGNMGFGMAQRLMQEGFNVVGMDLSAQRQEAAQRAGVTIATDYKELCQLTQQIILSLPMAKHVQNVLCGADAQGQQNTQQSTDCLINHAIKGTVIIDTSTSEPQVTKRLAAQLKEQGLHLLDCPVSGGPAGAAAGTMVMVVGGDQQVLEQSKPFLQTLTSKVVYLGESGNGHSAKLINNLLCAAHLVTTAEAIALGNQLGLDAKSLIEGLNAGSGRSAISEVNFPRWILNDEFNSGFTMQLMRKDVRLAKELIDKSGLNLAMSDLTAQVWADSAEQIADESDFNSIVKSCS
jgi:3-hydroxyisobutyrate dehydrogenase